MQDAEIHTLMLTTWEREFIRGLKARTNANLTLTEKQNKTLNVINEKLIHGGI